MTDEQFKRKCKKNRMNKFKQHKKYNSYKEYLLSNEWHKLRIKKFKQVGYSCQICDANKNLQIHHRTYKRIFKEELNDLTVLCEDCHQLYNHRHNVEEYIEQQIHIKNTQSV